MALKIEQIQRLDLGIQGEHNARAIVIDCGSWIQQFPNGSISLYHQRNGEAQMDATGASFDREEGKLTWTITSTDTYYEGVGTAEIRLTDGTITKKVKRALTLVRPSVVNDEGVTLDSGWQAYIDEVERQKSLLASEAEAWATGRRGGVDVEEGDDTYHNNSKYYADTMEARKNAYIAAIEAAGEAARALIPEDLSYYASAADVRAITQRFYNGALQVEHGGTGATTPENARANLGLAKDDIVNMIYPVGSIYMSANSTNPAILFGGTWTRIQDRFLLATGEAYGPNKTGGAESRTYTPEGTNTGTAITTAQMPNHTHSFTPAGTVTGGGHTHTLTPAGTISGGAHTHSFTPAGTVTGGGHTHTLTPAGSISKPTYSFAGNTHYHMVRGTNSETANVYVQRGNSAASVTPNYPTGQRWLRDSSGGFVYSSSSDVPTGKNYEQLITHETTQGGTVTAAGGFAFTGTQGTTSSATHNHTFTGAAGTTGSGTPTHTFTGTQGTTSSTTHNHSFAGTAGTTGDTGNGNTHTHRFTGTQATIDTMPPYYTVYVWQRMA